MNDGKIIIDKIMSDAKDAVNEIQINVNTQVEAIIKAAEEKAKKDIEKYDMVISEEKEKSIQKQISAAQMEAKKAILVEKQTLLDEVISKAHERLLSLSDIEYIDIIGQLLDSLDKSLGTEVITSKKDKDILKDIIIQKGFVLCDDTADIDGGVIIKSKDIEYNYSFDSILNIEREEIQQIAAKILFS